MYKKCTKHYNIPYISSMEKMESSEEEKAANIIDNMLYAATFGVDKAVFEDGNYRLNLEENGLYTLSIIPYEGYSFLGIVNYHLFSSSDIEQIKGLQSGNKYYIYVFYQDDLSVNPKNFYLYSTLYKLQDTSSLSIHVATIDLTGIEPKIDENPYTKKYTSNIVGHIKDNSNPHGGTLHQDNLNIYENLSLQGRKINSYEFSEIELIENKNNIEVEFDSDIEFVSHMFLSHPQNIWFEIKNKILSINYDGKKGKIKIKVEFK